MYFVFTLRLNMFHVCLFLCLSMVVADPDLRKGVITATWWAKGYAFVRDLVSKRELFLHRTGLVGQRPQVGDTVTFRIGSHDGKPCAISVRLVESADSTRSNDGGRDVR